jgi:hypothetical protein
MKIKLAVLMLLIPAWAGAVEIKVHQSTIAPWEQEAADREAQSERYKICEGSFNITEPDYETVFSSMTVEGWHCVEWNLLVCIREMGYRSDGIVVWRKP